MDSRYTFESTIAVKIIVRRQQHVLLVREPEINEWMPGRLGLPGGKVLLNETLEQALDRKIETEVGLQVKVSGIIRIVDILMPNKNVYQVIYLADYIDGEINTAVTESKDIRWYSKDEVTKLSLDDFTEYYNSELLLKVLDGGMAVVPTSLIQNQDNRTEAIVEWMKRGAKT